MQLFSHESTGSAEMLNCCSTQSSLGSTQPQYCLQTEPVMYNIMDLMNVERNNTVTVNINAVSRVPANLCTNLYWHM